MKSHRKICIKFINSNTIKIQEKQHQEKTEKEIQQTAKENKCEICDTVSTLLCSKCKNSHYCSKKCQTKDWKNHKEECKKINDSAHIYQDIDQKMKDER